MLVLSVGAKDLGIDETVRQACPPAKAPLTRSAATLAESDTATSNLAKIHATTALAKATTATIVPS